MSISNYPTDPIMTNLVQEWGNKATGFVHPCLFPVRPVPSCKFKWIDWENTLNQKILDDRVGPCSQVQEVNPSTFEWKYAEIESRGLDMPVCLECNDFCGTIPFDLEQLKLKELFDLRMLAKEKRAIDLAFKASAYAAAPAADPSSALVLTADGAKFDVAAATASGLNDTTYDFLKYFQTIQVKRRLPANIAVMGLEAYYALKRHPKFLGKNNCCDPIVGDPELAALLGVQKICISSAYYDSAASGLTPVQQQFLKGSILLVHNYMVQGSAPVGTETIQRAFGFEAVWRNAVVKRIPDEKNLGLEGGYYLRIGQHEKQVVADYKMATLLTNVLG